MRNVLIYCNMVAKKNGPKDPMYRIALTLFIWLMLPSHALAQMIDEQQCKNQQYTTTEVEGLLHIIHSTSDVVETVPPDEVEYIHNEARIALEQKNRARFNAVASRHYFAALEFHDDANTVIQNLTAARAASGRDLARYLVVALSGLGDLKEATNSYIDADLRRPSPLLTGENRSTLRYNLTYAKSEMVSLLQCVISVL